MSNTMIKLYTYPQTNFYDDDFQDNNLTVFTITEENLLKILHADWWDCKNATIEEFLNEYTWDDASLIYDEADREDLIESEEIIKRESNETYIKSMFDKIGITIHQK